jgi:SulP family sulfate permease
VPTRADLVAMRRQPRRDLLAGVTVAVVALPLALAFGVSSGVGTSAGLATAIVAGLLAALFGGSNLQVSGPTGAMTVIPGAFVRYVPAPVVEGFTGRHRPLIVGRSARQSA